MSELKNEILSQHIGLRHGYQFRESDFTETGIQVIKIGNVTSNGLDLETDVSFVSSERKKEFESITLKDGDILMSLTGNIGRVVEVQNLGNKTLFQNYRVGVFYPLNEEIYKPFIKWVLSSDEILRQLNTHANQSAQANFGKQDLDKLKFRFPAYPTQRKIAHILSTTDAVIEKTQAAIAKYKAIKQGMLHDLFTRSIVTEPTSYKDKTGKVVELRRNQLRPKYDDAPELYKESKLGWIPKEWEVFQINDCIDTIMSNVDKHIYENEIKILLCNYMDVYDNRYLQKNISFSNGSVNTSEMQRFSLKPQDVIITKDSETPDDIAVPTVLIENIENLICGYHLCILRSKDFQKLNGEFLMLQLQIKEINNQFARKANGSTRYGLTIDAIEKVYIKIPKKINEQVEIAHRLKTFENKIQTEQSYLHKLQQIKAGLMADLLSGKKEVVADEETVN